MNTPLYCIVYCSRNLIHGDQEQVAKELKQILASARTNNSRAGVTGALLYNAGNFAQVLEGSLSGIEPIFERIQRDCRHSEVTVIQSGPVEARQFPEWSMAFSGNALIEGDPIASAAFEAVFAQAAGGGEQILTMLQGLVVSEDDDYVLANVA